jgi:hypothetical protein
VLVVAVVDSHDEGGDGTLSWGSDEDLLCTSCDVLAGSSLVHEDTCSLNDDVDVHLLPGELGRVAVGDNADLLAIHGDSIVLDLHGQGRTVSTPYVAVWWQSCVSCNSHKKQHQAEMWLILVGEPCSGYIWGLSSDRCDVFCAQLYMRAVGW